MATYSIATTALALGTDRKRIENLLRRTEVSAIAIGRQGKARRLRYETVLGLAAVLALEDALGLRGPAAAVLAAQLRAAELSGATGSLRTGVVTVTFDFSDLERSVNARLAEALEIAPRPGRGRPKKVRSRDEE